MTAEAHRILMNSRNREKRANFREIGEIPPVANWPRRDACENDLHRFLLTYLAEAFPIPFSKKHIEVIGRLQNSLLHGNRVLLPIPRGFGKSTICVGAAIWGTLYGHRKYIPIITSGDGPAEARMNTIKALLETSPVLCEDFPEVCVPIRKLEGIPQRAGGMMYDGKPAKMSWRTFSIILPPIPELDPVRRQCRAAGSIISACGITSKRIRGLQHILPDGSIIRPDFVLIDDPQDDESAKSPDQVAKLLDILHSSILGLSGHKRSMAVAIACNILAPDDMIERLLDPEVGNGFEGERIPLVVKFPDAMATLWEQYRVLLVGYDKGKSGDFDRARREATAFYEANREAMDAGAEVTWEHIHDEHSVSGIQYAMNKFFTTPAKSFWAEYQNQPLVEEQDSGQLTADDILKKILPGQPRGTVPTSMDRVTAFVDIQGKCLFWAVVAWGEGFGGHVVDYGVFPEQKRRYFTLRDIPRTLGKLYPGGQEAIWRAALDALSEDLLSRQYERNDGTVLRIEMLFPDANEGNAREVVVEFCRNSKHPALVMPYTSRGVRAGDRPFADYAKKPGDTKGLNWRVPSGKGRRDVRVMVADVNYWKSFVRERWRTAIGDPGALTLYAGTPEHHALFVEHMTSEYSLKTEGRGRSVDDWRIRPNRKENHWWDCMVGAAVAASYRGTVLPEAGQGEQRGWRRRKTLAEARALRGRQ